MPLFRFFLVMVLILLNFFAAQGQKTEKEQGDDPPMRIEIPAKSDKETYRVIPCDTSGVIVFFRSVESAGENQTKWYFSSYDTDLNQQWTKNIPLISDQDFFDYRLYNDTLSLIFTHSGKAPKSGITGYQVLRIVLPKGVFILNGGKLPQDGVLNAAGIRHDYFWLGINKEKGAGEIGYLQMTTGRFKTFAAGLGSSIRIEWIGPDHDGSALTAVVSRKVAKKSTEYYLVTYDTTGKILTEIPFYVNNQGQDLTHFQVRDLSTGNQILAGSYGQQATTSKTRPGETAGRAGLFTAKLADRTVQSLSFYNFLELDHAGSYISEKERMELQRKAEKKNKTLKDFSVGFSTLQHELIPWNDQFLMVTEVYSPRYHTESFTEIDYYGRPYTNSYSVFDGYQFTVGIIAGLSNDGKLLWDNTIDFRNLISFDLTPKITLFPQGDDLVLCYMAEGKIGSKIIRTNQVIEKTRFSTLEMMYPEDKLVTESRSRIVKWYDQYFLTYGYQEIKNISLPGENKRLVFFISKVKFDL